MNSYILNNTYINNVDFAIRSGVDIINSIAINNIGRTSATHGEAVDRAFVQDVDRTAGAGVDIYFSGSLHYGSQRQGF